MSATSDQEDQNILRVWLEAEEDKRPKPEKEVDDLDYNNPIMHGDEDDDEVVRANRSVPRKQTPTSRPPDHGSHGSPRGFGINDATEEEEDPKPGFSSPIRDIPHGTEKSPLAKGNVPRIDHDPDATMYGKPPSEMWSSTEELNKKYGEPDPDQKAPVFASPLGKTLVQQGWVLGDTPGTIRREGRGGGVPMKAEVINNPALYDAIMSALPKK